MKQLKILAVALALTASAAVPAQADWTFDACGGSHFATCMSGSVTWNPTFNWLEVVITNHDSQVNFKTIGLVNLVNAGAVTGFTVVSSQTGTWGNPNDLGGDGIPDQVYQIGPGSDPNTNGLLAGTAGTFRFMFPNGFQELGTVGIGVHGISGPNGCSTKFAIWNGGNSTNDFGAEGGPGYDPNCVSTTTPPPTTTVPEPVTVLLLGTGLLAVAGVARRRRDDNEA